MIEMMVTFLIGLGVVMGVFYWIDQRKRHVHH